LLLHKVQVEALKSEIIALRKYCRGMEAAPGTGVVPELVPWVIQANTSPLRWELDYYWRSANPDKNPGPNPNGPIVLPPSPKSSDNEKPSPFI
jgi:hypothetical protein